MFSTTQNSTLKQNILLSHKLHDCTHFSKPICHPKTQQHGWSQGIEKRKKRLDKDVLQDVEGNRDNDRCVKTS